MAEASELTGEPTPPRRSRSRDARMVLTGVVAVLLIWFALANLQRVTVHFWVSQTRAPAIVVIVISGVLGALIGQLVGRRRRRGAGGPRRGADQEELGEPG